LPWYASNTKFQTGSPNELFPFTRSSEAANDARLIVIDPEIVYGRPAISGRGVPTDVTADRYLAGEPIKTLAEDCGADPSAIEEALHCELRRAA